MNIDKFNMRQVIISSASQLKKGLELAAGAKAEGNFSNVIICGMGGSALPVNVFNSIIKTKIPVYAHRDYGLSEYTSPESLVICISYSGNTEETLSAFQEALKNNLNTIGISSGGKLETLCKENNVPFVKLEGGIQPRCATGYIFSSLAKVLANSGVINDLSAEIIKTSEELEKISPILEKQGKKLSEKLFKKIPVVYASNQFKALARIWKIKFNENSKIPAFHNYFPELNHNEMVGYTAKTKDLFILILRDKASDHPRNLKRMDLTAKIIKKSGSKAEFIDIAQGSIMFKIFSSLLLGDWVSYYLALKNKIDPTPVKVVEDFKKALEK